MRLSLLLVAVLLLSLGVAGPAAADVHNDTNASDVTDTAQNATNITEEDAVPADCSEQIDANTFICSTTVSEGSTVQLELYSTEIQHVTVTDAGAIQQRGPINQESYRLLPDRRTDVVISATEVDGFVGVTVATSEVLYGVPLEEGSTPFLPGSPRSVDPAIAGATVFGLFVVAFPVGYYLVRRVMGGVYREF